MGKRSAARKCTVLTAAILTGLTVLHCIPTTLKHKHTIQPPHRIALTRPLTSDKFSEEITRLEIMLMLHDTASAATDSTVKDTTLTKDLILSTLFSLYIHVDNPQPDYTKAIMIADTLIYRKANSPKISYYKSWRRILEQYLNLQAVNDSLQLEISEKDKANKTLYYSARRQTKQIDSLSVRVIDSLSFIIKEQREKITKLQDLDMKIEQQRSKIQ